MTDEHTQMHENDSLIESFIPTDFMRLTITSCAIVRAWDGSHITAAYGNRLKRRHIAIPSA